MADDVAVTRVIEKGPCFYVEGRVFKNGGWLDAAFTAYKPDVMHMSRDEFHAFAKRQLPHVTNDINWQEHSVK